jgi:alpha-glucosidase
VNVGAQKHEPRSMLALTRRLLALRRQSAALNVGEYRPIDAPPPLFVFGREHGPSRYVTALNLGSEPQTVALPPAQARGAVAISTHLDREGEPVSGTLHLRGDEGVLIRLE